MPNLPPSRWKSKYRRRRSTLGDEIGTVLHPSSHVQTVLGTITGDDVAAKICWGAQHVKLGELVGGVEFEDQPVHPPNSAHERRMAALTMMILECVSSRGRAWTSDLFRGRNRRFLPDGSTEYCPGKSAGGLAARLKVDGVAVSPRQVDRYLQVLKALGVFEIYQGPKTCAEKFKGLEYAYAVFRWLGEVPRAVATRLQRIWGTEKRIPTPNPPIAPPPPVTPSIAAAELAAKLLDAASQAPRPGEQPEATRERGNAAATARFLALLKPG